MTAIPSSQPKKRSAPFKILWGLVALFLCYSLAGFVLLPRLGEHFLPKLASAELGRQTTVEKIRFNPFSLSLEINGLRIEEPAGTGEPFFGFLKLFIDLDAASFPSKSLIISRVLLEEPFMGLSRREDNRFNFSDLLDKPPQPEEDKPKKPFRFSINNIELKNGALTFRDAPKETIHQITAINLGLPFLSNFAHATDIFVRPSFSVQVNGTPFSLSGRAKPFAADLPLSLAYRFQDLDLPSYMSYLPGKPNFGLRSGKLSAQGMLSFTQPGQDSPPDLRLEGTVQLADLHATAADGSDLLVIPALRTEIDRIEVFRGDARIGLVSCQDPTVWLTRQADGRLNLVSALAGDGETPAPSPKSEKEQTENKEKPPFLFSIAEAELAGGTVHFADQAGSEPFKTTVSDLSLALRDVTNSGGNPTAAPTVFTLKGRTDAGEGLSWKGRYHLAPLRLNSRLELTGLDLPRFAPYSDAHLPDRIGAGRLDLAADLGLHLQPGANAVTAENISGRLDGLRLDEKTGGKLAAFDLLSLTGGLRYEAASGSGRLEVGGLALGIDSFQLRTRADNKEWIEADRIALGGDIGLEFPEEGPLRLAASNLQGVIHDLALHDTASGEKLVELARFGLEDGELHLPEQKLRLHGIGLQGGHVTLRREADGTINLTRLAPVKKTSSPAPAAASPPSKPWLLEIRNFKLADHQLLFNDRTVAPQVNLDLRQISIDIENFSTAAGSRIPFAVALATDNKGSIDTRGELVLAPLQLGADCTVRSLALPPLQGYISPAVNLQVNQGSFSGSGRVQLQKNPDRPLRLVFKGDAGIAGFTSYLPGRSERLLSWQKLSADGIDLALPPARIEIDTVKADSLYAGLVLQEDGSLNLRGLAREQTPSETEKSAPPVPAGTDSGMASAPLHLQVGSLQLEKSEIFFLDRNIKPPYETRLQEINGTLVNLSSAKDQAAEIEIEALLDGQSPLVIRGTVSPLAEKLSADLRIDWKNIELSPASPYSGKYIGQLIKQGKLSLNLEYKIADGRIKAHNRAVLDQFNLGNRVESKDAVSLPITLAIALLKNRAGEIRLNVPVEGDLNDPKVSVAGLVFKALFNLIMKAVTAPFTLIGAVLGGGEGEDMSRIDFAAGDDTLDDEAKRKLAALEAALYDRPAIKLQISGYYDPEADRPAYTERRFNELLQAQKREELVRGGTAATPENLRIGEEEYEKYLEEAYKVTMKKRPFLERLDFRFSVPPEEMRQVILDDLTPSDGELGLLAGRRAGAVEDFLTAKGRVEAKRLFLVKPDKLDAPPREGGSPGSRVELTLK